jgi:hypothetical protein
MEQRRVSDFGPLCGRLGLCLRFWFAETDLVAKGVEEVQLICSPVGFVDTRAPVGVVFGGQLSVQLAHSFEGDLKARAG